MAKKPRLEVVRESSAGRNERFRYTQTGVEMTRAETVRRIDQGAYPDYHTRNVNGVRTPVSNPNRRKGDNLG